MRRPARSRLAALILPAAVALSGLTLSGCAYLEGGRNENLPSAAELGAGDCRQAGPQDPAAPGEWICDRGDTPFQRTRPRHRVEND